MNWNGRFMGAGNWGWAGSIRYDGLEMGLKDGYAVASNDTGHTKADGQTGEFAIGHPDKVIDYGWRANHAMTLNAKAIIKNFYGVGPEHSYWVGCSLGGQQGMTEIQRFPYDYDGAVIGQPAWPIIQLNAAQIWPALLARQNPEGLLSAGKLAMVQEAIKKACATPEDLKLGYLGDPASCHFDPKTLLCKGADSDNCLTAAQVDMIEKVHNGLINPRTGEHITLPEIGWGAGAGFSSIRVGVSQGQENPMQVAVGLYKYLVFQDPNWDWTTLDMDKDLDFAEKVLSTVNKADNPNLKPFFDLGGKLLLYESTAATTNYYKEVLKTVGPEAKDSIRAFNMEGMAHCGGGTGCDQFDKLGVIDQWVGGGKAPDEIVAFKSSDNKVTHLLCAYPNVAKYKGTGDVKDADSFICGE